MDEKTLDRVYEITVASFNRSFQQVRDLDYKASQLLSVTFIIVGLFSVGFNLQFTTKELDETEHILLSVIGCTGIFLLIGAIGYLLKALQIQNYTAVSILKTIKFARRYPDKRVFQKKLAYDWGRLERRNVLLCAKRAQDIKKGISFLTLAIMLVAIQITIFAWFFMT